MLLLALDTATLRGGLALLEGERLLGQVFLETPGSFLVHLLPALDGLLARTGRGLEELAAICVSQGPGNFTGLRIGLATAQGLALALGCALVPVPTLEVLAAAWAGSPHPVVPLVDAKRGEVFWAQYDCRGEFPVPQGEPRRHAAAALPGLLNGPLLVTGPALDSLPELASALREAGFLLAPAEHRLPDPSWLGRLGYRRLEQGLTVPPSRLTPLYLRPAL